jgi:protein-L-isoaspartate(D-aspartate) O-methyltransferase
VPEQLLQQLAVGARLIAPVNAARRLDNVIVQELLVITRTEDGFERQQLEDVSFVPLLSGLA